MWDFSIQRSIQLLLKTMPFLLLRCAIYFGIALGYILVTAFGAGLGWAIGGLGSDDFRATATAVGALAGLGLTTAVLFLLREYLLYMVKAGHIATLVLLLDGKSPPEGRSQIRHATEVVKARFTEASTLFALDLLIRGVIRTLSGLTQGLLAVLPIPGSQQLMGVVRAFLRMSVGLADEVILAYAIRTESSNPWSSAQSALVLYGQNARFLLKNAAWLTVFTYTLAALVFVVMLLPAAGLAWLMPGGWSASAVLIALLLAWAFKVALIEPFAIACLLQAYFKVIEGQNPNPEWEQRLETASEKFRELKEKARTWGTSPATDRSARPDAA